VRNLGLCESLVVGQFDRRALRFRELQKRRADARNSLRRDCFRLLPDRRVRHVGDDTVRDGRASFAGAYTVYGPRPGHHQQPSDDRCPRRVIPGDLAPGLREHLLDDVFGVAAIRDDAHGERVHTAAVAIVQFPERFMVAGRQEVQECSVSHGRP